MSKVAEYQLVMDGNKANNLIMEREIDYQETNLHHPRKIVDFLKDIYDMENLAVEHLYLLAHDTKMNVIGIFLIGKGTVNGVHVTPREIYISALLAGAVNITLCHNHPSGDSSASREDIKMAERIEEAGKIVGVSLVDNIIIGKGEYYSFAEQDLL